MNVELLLKDVLSGLIAGGLTNAGCLGLYEIKLVYTSTLDQNCKTGNLPHPPTTVLTELCHGSGDISICLEEYIVL